MAISKSKWLFFGAGLGAGLLLGWGVPMWGGDTPAERAPSQEAAIAPAQPAEDATEVAPEPEKTAPANPPASAKPAATAQTTPAPVPTPSADPLDTVQVDTLAMKADSVDTAALVLQDTLITNDSVQNTPPGEIIVKQDQLVKTLSVKLYSLDSLAPTNQPSRQDSVLQSLSGMAEPVARDDYEVEFWQSPINYKGYKMANNKIVLFGLDANEAVNLYQWQSEYYLSSARKVYQISPTFAFKNYSEVRNDSILNQLGLNSSTDDD